MHPRLILFDIDGTLIDTAGAGRRAMEQACLEVFRIDGIDAKAREVRYAGMTDPVILEAVCRAIGVSERQFAADGDRLRESFLSALEVEMGRPDPRRRVLPGVRPLLDDLCSRDGVHLGLLTGNLERGARAKLEPFDLNRFFPGGGFSSDHRDRREIARVAWRKMSDLTGIAFTPSDVAVIGDTEHDVDCAKAHGFHAVAVDSGWVARSRLERAAPDRLLDDLSDRGAALEALGIA